MSEPSKEAMAAADIIIDTLERVLQNLIAEKYPHLKVITFGDKRSSAINAIAATIDAEFAPRIKRLEACRESHYHIIAKLKAEIENLKKDNQGGKNGDNT